MANTLTALANVLYTEGNVVAQEDFGFLQGVRKDFSDKGASEGDTIKIPYAPPATTSSFTPAMTRTAGTNKTAATLSITLDNNEESSFHLTGEEEKMLQNAGSDKEWFGNLVQEAMRAVRNSHESSLFTSSYQGACRASGTAGTNPFTSGVDALVEVRRELKINGCPMNDVQCIISSTSEANLLKLDLIQQAHAAGGSQMRDTGVLNKFFGIKLRTSEQIEAHTKGTGANLDVIAGGEPVAETTIYADTGTGTVLAGDVITLAGSSTYKYVVNEALTEIGGYLKIGRPGLKVAVSENDEIAVGNAYTPQVCFERNAIVSVQRPPAIERTPMTEIMLVSDVSGYTYMLAKTYGYGMTTYALHSIWGNKVINPHFVINLMG
jgi:hypothetical protein